MSQRTTEVLNKVAQNQQFTQEIGWSEKQSFIVAKNEKMAL